MDNAVVDDLLKQVQAKEAECLTTIHARFCLLKGVKININDLHPKEIPGRGNYWEYWINLKGQIPYLLMSRELKIVDNEPVLEITFNKELQ